MIRFKGLVVFLYLGAGIATQTRCWANDLPATEARQISRAVGSDMTAYQGERPEQVNKEIVTLLSKPLDLDCAVRLALLNNRRIQATLKDLLASRADLRESRLLPNPSFSATLFGKGDRAHNEYTVTEDVLGVLLYPWKRRAGSASYTAAQLQIIARLQEQVAEVKTSFIRLQSLLESRQVLEPTYASAKITSELTERQRKAGNISALQEATQSMALQEATLGLMRTDAEITGEKAHVRELLGLEESQLNWSVEVHLPTPPDDIPSAIDLQKIAVESRPELSAARAERTALDRRFTVSRLEFIPTIEAGVGTQKEEGVRRSGPVFRVSVPIFNRGQAMRGRILAERDKKANELWALEVETRSEIETDLARMEAARKTEAYLSKEVIPLRRTIVEETQKHYNFMLVGIYQLLQAKQMEISSEREVIDARRDYWIARAELERTIGRPLPVTAEAKDNSSTSEEDSTETPAANPENNNGENHEN